MRTNMKTFVLSVAVLSTCLVITESLPTGAANREAFVKLVEELEELKEHASSLIAQQDPVQTTMENLTCAECAGNTETECTLSQIEVECGPNEVCTTLEAFNLDTFTTTVTRGCFDLAGGSCDVNPGCDALNTTGVIQSCEQFCCSISLCNSGFLPTQATTAASTTMATTTEATTAMATTTEATTTMATTTEATTTMATTTEATTTMATTTEATTTMATTTPMPTAMPTPMFVCGGVLTTPSGAFTSPNFPNGYPNGIRCVWTVLLPVSISQVQFIVDPITLNDAGDSLAFIDNGITVTTFRGPNRRRRSIDGPRLYEEVFGEDADRYYDDGDYNDYYYYDNRRKEEPYFYIKRKKRQAPSVVLTNRQSTVVFTTDDTGNAAGFRTTFGQAPVPTTTDASSSGSGSESSDED